MLIFEAARKKGRERENTVTKSRLETRVNKVCVEGVVVGKHGNLIFSSAGMAANFAY